MQATTSVGRNRVITVDTMSRKPRTALVGVPSGAGSGCFTP
jgi:hypothetical protein